MKWFKPDKDRWRGQTAVVIAGGTSVTMDTLAFVHERTEGRRTIAVNSVYRHAPWATFAMFQDLRWWEREQRVNGILLKKFRGRFVTTKTSATLPAGVKPLLRYARRSPLTTLRPALMFAADFGAKRIVLVGADNREGKDGRGHFHEEHPWPRDTPNYWGDKHDHLARLAKNLDKEGVEVLNVSPISTLEFWPYVPLLEALTDG